MSNRRGGIYFKSAISAHRKGKRICEKANGDHPANMGDIHR